MRHVLSLTRRCVEDYNMIQAGDRVAVGVSGGKDSLLLLYTLAKLRAFFPAPFEVEAVTLSMGFEGCDFSPVAALCGELGVRHTLVPTQLGKILFETRKEKNPCSLCAKMRRGILHNAAVSLDCNKVALGHHFDDAAETFMLSLFFEGRLSCFQPVSYLDRKQLTLIRPLLYLHESEVRAVVRREALPVCHNPCPANGNTKRQEVKELLSTLEAQFPDLRTRIFGAMQRLPLDGWASDAAKSGNP